MAHASRLGQNVFLRKVIFVCVFCFFTANVWSRTNPSSWSIGCAFKINYINKKKLGQSWLLKLRYIDIFLLFTVSVELRKPEPTLVPGEIYFLFIFFSLKGMSHCVRYPWWRTKAKEAIIFTYFFWPMWLACALRAPCVRHACAMRAPCVRHACAMRSLAIVITIVQSFFLSSSFFFPSVFCFWPTLGNLPCAK